jgi:hypothetical protein
VPVGATNLVVSAILHQLSHTGSDGQQPPGKALHPHPRPRARRVVLVQGGGAASCSRAPGDRARHGRVGRAPGALGGGCVVRGLLAAAPGSRGSGAGLREAVVGHSLGGLSVALAMERFPRKVAASVFLTACMPCVGKHMGVTG